MPVATYETLFLLDATKVTADADGVKQQMHTLLEKHGAQISVSRPWDYNHTLKYPIEGKKKGAFHIVYYTLESTKQVEFEKDVAITEVILRQLTLKIDPKWEEAILDVAKNEAGSQFAVRGMQDEAQITSAEPGSRDMAPPMGEPAAAGAGGGFRRGRRDDRPEKPE